MFDRAENDGNLMFSAVLIEKGDAGQSVAVTKLHEADLPEGNVSIDVDYSTLNYKDALAITGSSPVVRKFPMVPGIDLAGTVTESAHPKWSAGDRVVLNGWGVGETHWGGLAQRARLNGDWLIGLPENLSTWQTMAIGTAGYTASLCVSALVDHDVRPEQGPVLVTGATGGVGSVAISLLSAAGFEVAAVTGKDSQGDYLKQLGANTVLARDEFSGPGRPMQKERWAGVIDCVGSHTLANACAQTRYGGAVAACGLVQGMDFPASVAPFILRGVRLLGVDSVMAPLERRESAWSRIGRDLDLSALDAIAQDVTLADAVATASQVLEGQVRGRIVVNVNK
jgi:acrylyl-CoA reductase (NADPH)